MIRERAPLRVDIGGGVTDIPEFSREVGTSVTNFALDLYSGRNYIFRRGLQLEISKRGDSQMTFIYNGLLQALGLSTDDPLSLPKSAISRFRSTHSLGHGYQIKIDNNLPQSTGLGGSAGLSVSLIVGLNRMLAGEANIVYTPDPNIVLKDARRFEVEEMGIRGGFQDFIGAFFGNVNQIDFQSLDSVDLSKYPKLGVFMEPQIKNYLDCHMLVLLQRSGNISSSIIVEDEINRYGQNPKASALLLLAIKECNNRIYEILIMPGDIKKRLVELGECMNRSWSLQKELSPLVGRGRLAELEKLVSPFVFGLRGPGAGGNSLFLVVKPNCLDSLTKKLSSYSGSVEILFAKVNETGVQKTK